MKKYFAFLFLFTFISFLSSAQLRIVLLGSSTAQGDGASIKDSAWAYRYTTYLKSLNPENELINLAKGGYTTYHILPTDVETLANRPKPDTNRNISKALSYNPDAIIINLPSNDAANLYSLKEQLINYKMVMQKADAAKIPVWIATTQPRNMSKQKQQLLLEMRDSTFSIFGDKAIDFFNGLEAEKANLRSLYDSGDGIHLNNAGHKVLFDRVVEKNIPGFLDKE